jgi:hypothetical protein
MDGCAERRSHRRRHFAEVAATEPFIVPASIYDEVFEVGERLGITP